MVLAVLTISGGAIRAYNIVAKSLWFDEAVVFWISRGEDLSSMITANAQMNSAPPLYVILVHLVSEIGTNEAILRSISWLAGTAAIPLIYMLGVRYVSKRAALASATILAVTPVYVEYSQQLREYSLAFCISALMLLAYGEFKENGSWKSLAFVVVTFGIGIFTQYGLGLLILSLNIAFLVEVMWFRKDTHKMRKWILGQGFVLLGVVFVWSSTLRYQFSVGGYGHVARGYFQGPLPTLPAFLFRQTYDIVLFAFPDPPLIILLVGTAIISGIAGGNAIHKYAHLFIPFLVAAAAGVGAFYPYVGARQSIYLFPILSIFVAMGFDYLIRADTKGIVPILFALLVIRAALLPTLGYLRSEGIENLKPLVQQLNEDIQPGDRVFVCSGAMPAFRYYYRRDLGAVVGGSATEMWQEEYSKLLDNPGRVWLVVSHCGDPLTYVRFAAEHRLIDEIGSRSQAWLYLSP
jgi:uncharacterized membrane protein